MPGGYHNLVDRLRRNTSILVAFSGGADSTLLLRAVSDAGIRALAVTASSPLMPEGELHHARQIAAELGMRHRTVQTDELSIPGFAGNPEDRCYLCKAHRYDLLVAMADEEEYETIADGSNLDDLRDYRPGMRAVREREILTPLVDAGLTKSAVRELSRKLGLKTWNKPASPCLATRIPYGSQITVGKLRMIEHAEASLARLGFHEFRVRTFDETARIEVAAEEMQLLLDTEVRKRIVDELRHLGYRSITIDLEGFRSGKLNPEKVRDKDSGFRE